MANVLKMALIEAMLSLHGRGWSRRRIARELGVDRDTVSRHLQRSNAASAPLGADHSAGGPNAASAPLGADHPAGGSNAASAPLGTKASGSAGAPDSPCPEKPSRGASVCGPWRGVIQGKLDQGLSAQRIYQDLVSEHGFAGSYYSVRRFVRRLDQRQALPFRRLECGPGDEAQVDFGAGIPIRQLDGRKRRTHVFRIVLSHSRKGYSEAVFRQTTEEFLRCLENAFHHFAGVPKALVLDNLKAGVVQPDWFDPELNPKLRSFALHYGLAILPTRPRTPRHKGKIESGVGYVKKNALLGHVFASLEEENRHLLQWETTVADVRIHGTMRQQVGKVFAEVERAALQPLPAERFPVFEEGQRTVHRDGHVEVAKAYYSVPPEYLGRAVWVRWDGRLVRVFNHRFEAIAVHVRVEAGTFSTQALHVADEKISGVERGAAWLLRQVRRLGPHTTRWAQAMLQARGIEGVRVLQGLRHLGDRHPGETLEKACEIALAHASYRLRTLRQLLDRQRPRQEVFEFMHEHALIRPLSEYGQLVRQAIRKEQTP
jgi:transposase